MKKWIKLFFRKKGADKPIFMAKYIINAKTISTSCFKYSKSILIMHTKIIKNRIKNITCFNTT